MINIVRPSKVNRSCRSRKNKSSQPANTIEVGVTYIRPKLVNQVEYITVIVVPVYNLAGWTLMFAVLLELTYSKAHRQLSRQGISGHSN